MKKKSTIIFAVLAAVVVLGFVISRYVDWPVDDENASGNIAKSSRFSRKTADGNVGNMKDLLQNDEDYKNGIVAAYLVMKARADQFNALVDMSAEVAGGIPELGPVLKEMKEALPMVKNVCASMEAAGKDLDSALGGEDAEDLEQNTANAALAYNTLQKQNKLADQFIEAVDNYQQKTKADDRLKFVRDQWVDYQQMTAALNKDENLAQKLGKKGYLLPEDKRAAALGSFGEASQATVIGYFTVSKLFNVSSAISNSVIDQAINANPDLGTALSAIVNAKEAALNANVKEAALNANVKEAALNASVKEEALKANLDGNTLNASPVARLRAQDIGPEILLIGMIQGLVSLIYLQKSVDELVLGFSSGDKMGQSIQTGELLSNTVGEALNMLMPTELQANPKAEDLR